MSKNIAISLGICLIVLTSCAEFKSIAEQAGPVVTTSYGQIAGIQDENAMIFLGVPYAQPPLGDLRWHETVDAKPWRPNVLDASVFKPACPQGQCDPTQACPNAVKFLILLSNSKNINYIKFFCCCKD